MLCLTQLWTENEFSGTECPFVVQMQPMKYHHTGSLRKALFLAALAATVVLASSRTVLGCPDWLQFHNFDKVAHFAVFGLLATLVVRIPWVRKRRPLGILTAVMAVSLFGITDELHQSFTPGRSVDVWDWVADTIGAAVAVAVYARWAWYRATLERQFVRWGKERVEIDVGACVISLDGFGRGETTDRGPALAGRAA